MATPRATPSGETCDGGCVMPECGACGRHVTVDYYRVFADNDGVVHGCPVCRPRGSRHAAEGGV